MDENHTSDISISGQQLPMYRFLYLNRAQNLAIYSLLILFFLVMFLGIFVFFEIPFALFFFTNQSLLIVLVYLIFGAVYTWKDYNLDAEHKPSPRLKKLISFFQNLAFSCHNIVAILYWSVIIHFDFKHWSEFSIPKKVYYPIYTLATHLFACLICWIFLFNHLVHVKKINYKISLIYLGCYTVVYAYYATLVRPIYGPLTLRWYPTYIFAFIPFGIQFISFKFAGKVSKKKLKQFKKVLGEEKVTNEINDEVTITDKELSEGRNN